RLLARVAIRANRGTREQRVADLTNQHRRGLRMSGVSCHDQWLDALSITHAMGTTGERKWRRSRKVSIGLVVVIPMQNTESLLSTWRLGSRSSVSWTTSMI